jgi:predicted Zn-dependent protease with MMP-like domain
MDARAFETMAREELERIPPRFARRMRNVAILIDDAPSPAVCKEEGLGEGETLLGLYRGVPATERGEGYSGILPDTITLYRLPILEEAEALFEEKRAADMGSAARLAIRETLWHELGHHFGLSEDGVAEREVAGTNDWQAPPRVLVRAGPFAALLARFRRLLK